MLQKALERSEVSLKIWKVLECCQRHYNILACSRNFCKCLEGWETYCQRL